MTSSTFSTDVGLSVKVSIPVKSDLGIKFDGRRENFYRWRDALKLNWIPLTYYTGACRIGH